MDLQLSTLAMNVVCLVHQRALWLVCLLALSVCLVCPFMIHCWLGWAGSLACLILCNPLLAFFFFLFAHPWSIAGWAVSLACLIFCNPLLASWLAFWLFAHQLLPALAVCSDVWVAGTQKLVQDKGWLLAIGTGQRVTGRQQLVQDRGWLVDSSWYRAEGDW